MIQIIDNFEHRSKLPNFARDQFDTLEEMKNVRDEDIDEGHISYCISTDKHYKFNASNAIDQSTGKWREFKGEKGDPGKDGQDGTNVLSNLTAFVFKSSETTPSKPVGGSWNSDTNVFTPPTGWYTTDQNMVGTIWMSWAVFQTTGTIQGEWSTPVRITGENGKDGQDGKSIEFIYKVSNRVPNSSDKPSSVNEDGNVPDGWTDHPTGVSESNQYEWMCVRTKTDDLWSDWNGPTVWSKWGANGKDGVPGPAGEDGKTLYTWIKYADTMPTSSSSTIYDIPNENTKYIGIAVNKDTASESTDAMVYTWSLFRGADGTNGTNGKDGRDGRIVYPAGIYDATVTYTATDTKAPYVLYGETYYVMNVTTSWTGSQNDGKTPADDYEQYGEHATWIPMEKFEAVYAKLLIADNGTLGKFVFNGNYMFSQQGKDGSGNSSSDYENFNPDRPDSGNFQPNLYIDGLTGKIVASNAYVKGSYKEQAKLVTNSDYYFLEYGGGIISVNRSVDDLMGKNTHQHVSVGSGWIYNSGNPEKEWSSYTITNVSDTPLLITNYFSGCFRAFSYLNSLYYGVILPDKYSSVTLRRVRVPDDTPVDFDGLSNAGYVNEIALIQPGQNRVTTNVTWTVGKVNYNMIQL